MSHQAIRGLQTGGCEICRRRAVAVVGLFADELVVILQPIDDPLRFEDTLQGRVLSPLLFNILMNSLAATVRRSLHPDDPSVTLLLYADDLVVHVDILTDLLATLF